MFKNLKKIKLELSSQVVGNSGQPLRPIVNVEGR